MTTHRSPESPEPSGRWPVCSASNPQAEGLLEYERADGTAGQFVTRPRCREVVQPR